MKYWEVIADKLHAAGWSWGYCSAVTLSGPITLRYEEILGLT